MKLAGRRAVITGANQGLGAAIARAFVDNGADVMLCARGEKLLEKVRADLSAVQEPRPQGSGPHTPRVLSQKADVAKPDEINAVVEPTIRVNEPRPQGSVPRPRVLAQKADVAKPDEINAVVERTIRELGGLEILVCNAGIYGPKGPIEEVAWDEWVDAIHINLMGVVLTCRAALRHFKAQKYGKIILLSGGGATKALPFLSAYAASKAAVVRFGDTLAEEVAGLNIDVNSVAPGALNTRLVDEILEAGPDKVGQKFYEQNLKFKSGATTPLEKGASLCVYLASSESDGLTGKLISAAWDPWENFAPHMDDLKTTDIYTLRRIVPEDRGKKW